MPPDPAPRPDGSGIPGIPTAVPEPPNKPRKINWTAVGSVAAVAAALIAFLAYVLPPGPTPPPVPTPPTTTSTTPMPTPHPSPAPVSSITQSSGPLAGCRQADAAIATFNNLDGATNQSNATAANQAGQQIEEAYRTALSSGASSAVSSDLYALIQDFGALQNTALFHDGSDYNTALTQTNKHIKALDTACTR